jgi:hypothetical protein
MQESLIFTDDNEHLRSSYSKFVKAGSIATICVGALSGAIALLGTANVFLFGTESDDALFITIFALIALTYALLSVRKWAHVGFVVASVLNALLLLAELIGTGVELLEGVSLTSLILLGVTAGQVVVTALVARGLIFARKLRRLRFDELAHSAQH